MTIKKKAKTEKEFVEKGGEVAHTDKPKKVRCALDLTPELLQQIDEKRKTRPGRVSRTLWIIEAIDAHLKRRY